MRRETQHGCRPARVAALVAAAAGAAAGPSAWALEAWSTGARGEAALATGNVSDSRQPGEVFDGRGFGGARLGIDAVEGRVDLAAQRAWTWTVGGSGDGPTTRVVLDGAVEAVIGAYRFRAARAAVWVQALPGEGGGGDGVYQVFAWFEDVRAEGGGVIARSATLPVRAVVRARGPVGLVADLRLSGPPEEPGLVAVSRRGEAELARLLAAGAGGVARPRGMPSPAPLPTEPGAPRRREVSAAGEGGLSARARLFGAEGVFFFSAGERVSLETRELAGREETVAYLTGGLVIQYDSPEGALELTAQRGVVFMAGSLTGGLGGPVDAERVVGVYLEGGVRAVEANYRVETEAAYYDVRGDRALLLDAVFDTRDERTGSALYVRARSVRQRSSRSFEARGATVANTGFFRPHLALGASRVTVTQREDPGQRGGGGTLIEARGLTVRAAGTPLVWWPRYAGEPERAAFREVSVSNSNRTGAAVQTAWDFFGLAGLESPEGVEALLDLDYFFDGAFGIGTRTAWSGEGYRGELEAYAVPSDNGEDVLRSGAEFDRDGEFRGFARVRNRWALRPEWALITEGVTVSDPAFLQVFRQDLVRDGDPLTTRAHLRRLEGNSLLEVEARAQTSDDVLNENLLQSVGYAVDRLPYVRATQQAIDLTPGERPGLVTYTWEASYGLLRARLSESAVTELGLEDRGRALDAFGVLPNRSIADRLRAAGLNESFVNRFDTRHELAVTADAGPVKINPFAVGRVTAYDSGFDAFSPGEDDRVRLWGSVGTRVSTSLVRVDNAVESALLGLHRLRHVVEPSVTVSVAGSTVDSGALPVFDDDVEAVIEGGTLRAGLEQTWQTKRGGPGRWYDADVLRLDVSYVATTEEDRESPIGRFFGARPELTVPGEYVDLAAAYALTDAVSLSGETIYDIESGRSDRSSLGLLIDNGRGLRTSTSLRTIENQDVTFLTNTAVLKLTEKYDVAATAQLDFRRDEFADFRLTVLRAFPNGRLGVEVGFDANTDETSFGFVFQPAGAGGGVPGLGGVTGIGRPRQRGLGGSPSLLD